MVSTMYSDARVGSYRPVELAILTRGLRFNVLDGLKSREGCSMDYFCDMASNYCAANGLEMNRLVNGSRVIHRGFEGSRFEEGFSIKGEAGDLYDLIFLKKESPIDEFYEAQNEEGVVINKVFGGVVAVNSVHNIVLPSKEIKFPEVVSSDIKFHYLASDPLAKFFYDRLSR